MIDRPPARPQKSIVRVRTTDWRKAFETVREDMSVPSSGVTDVTYPALYVTIQASTGALR